MRKKVCNLKPAAPRDNSLSLPAAAGLVANPFGTVDAYATPGGYCHPAFVAPANSHALAGLRRQGHWSLPATYVHRQRHRLLAANARPRLGSLLRLAHARKIGRAGHGFDGPANAVASRRSRDESTTSQDAGVVHVGEQRERSACPRDRLVVEPPTGSLRLPALPPNMAAPRLAQNSAGSRPQSGGPPDQSMGWSAGNSPRSPLARRAGPGARRLGLRRLHPRGRSLPSKKSGRDGMN